MPLVLRPRRFSRRLAADQVVGMSVTAETASVALLSLLPTPISLIPRGVAHHALLNESDIDVRIGYDAGLCRCSDDEDGSVDGDCFSL